MTERDVIVGGSCAILVVILMGTIVNLYPLSLGAVKKALFKKGVAEYYIDQEGERQWRFKPEFEKK